MIDSLLIGIMSIFLGLCVLLGIAGILFAFAAMLHALFKEIHYSNVVVKLGVVAALLVILILAFSIGHYQIENWEL